jgi:SAM-dependent methyltransferase
MAKENIYQAKHTGYFQGERPDIIALLPSGSNRVLELGCGAGRTLINARQQGKASEIVGIDIILPNSEHGALDAYLQADVDTLELPYPCGYFDVIICADVLEHLVDPWGTIARLVPYLKTGGMLVSSLPNSRDYLMFAAIFVKGDFRYTDQGLFDRGHLRFFCKKNMRELFEKNGLIVERFSFRLAKLRKVFNIITGGLFEEFMVKQYLVVACKPSS